MYKLLVVRYDSSLGSYDDAEFTKFCESNQILHIDKEFVQTGSMNHLITILKHIALMPAQMARNQMKLSTIRKVQ